MSYRFAGRSLSVASLLAVKRFEVVLHFEGPLFKWSGKVDEREVIARKTFRWKWMAEGWARGRLGGLRQCGYVIRDSV
jgi:hypothetical protein